MIQCLLRDVDAAEHARKFLDALFMTQYVHPGSRGFAICHFADTEMLCREARNLRQMCHAQDLAMLAELGKPPAHRILTAYGLMEFYDMAKVHNVDPAVISRTQQWLAKQQDKDGSYKPTKGGTREGAINKFTDDVFRNTAYITWALASTEYQGPELGKGIQYLKDHLDDMKDNYTIVIVTHNMQQAARVSDYTAFMYIGELIEVGDTDSLFTNPQVKQTEDYITGRYG